MEHTLVIYGRATSTTSPVAIAVGACLALILYGQVSQGAYQYFRRYPKDGYDLKAIHPRETPGSAADRALISIFDTLHTVCVTHVCYVSLTGASSHSGEALLSFVFSLWHDSCEKAVGPSSGITLIIAHCFFARRLYKLGRQPMAFNILMAALSLLLIGSHNSETSSVYVTEIEIIVTLNISLLANIALTWRLVLHLRKSRTGFTRLHGHSHQELVHFSVNTGTSACLVPSQPFLIFANHRLRLWLAGLAAWPSNFAYFPVTAVLAPVHASVVLAALNSRRSLVDRGSEGIELRSFDLDIAPRLDRSATIQFRTPSGTILEGPGGEASAHASAGGVQSIQLQFGPLEDRDFETASVRKAGSVLSARTCNPDHVAV
ncbi:hypothetical protein C8T65DRAFT_641907 [Cerioporus squamosus]|nr:hypothetical protein C8T65DRAFT_641907 [Cerioporus squamosus]